MSAVNIPVNFFTVIVWLQDIWQAVFKAPGVANFDEFMSEAKRKKTITAKTENFPLLLHPSPQDTVPCLKQMGDLGYGAWCAESAGLLLVSRRDRAAGAAEPET